MPPPTRPSLSVVTNSPTQFTATVSGGDAGVTNRLYYRKSGALSDTTGPTRTGNGAFSAVSSLTTYGSYVVWCVSDDGSSYSLPAFAYVSLAEADTLTGAIHALFNSDAALSAAISGGLWTGEVPEGTAPPYAWLDIDYLNPEPMMVPEQWEAGRFRVSIFGIGAESAERCASIFRARFDYYSLPFSSDSQFANAQLMPKQYRLRCENLRYKNSRLIYRATLIYHILYTRPR